AISCARLVFNPWPCGELPLLAFEETRGIHRQLDPLEPRNERHAARGESRAARPGSLGKHRYAEAEVGALGARPLLPRTERGDVDQFCRSLHRLAVAAAILHDAAD